jgi:hypothetical protein
MDFRNNNHRISVVSIILFFLCSGLLFSQEKIGKEVLETYTVSNDSKLSIINKYGNIDVKNWDKKTIEVKVQIKFSDISDSKAKELMDMITIVNNTVGSQIKFETQFDEDFGKILNRLSAGNRKFEVNYIINMPHYVPVDLNNKYGNVFVNKLSTASKIEVKYGMLKANDISSTEKSPMTEITMGYSDGNIEACSWLKLTIKYSKITIEESKALIIVSKYSKIFVEHGSSIVTESRYDTYGIGSIANFVSDAEYSNFKFTSISIKLHADTQYTDVKVEYMPSNFDEIKILNSYGSYIIGLAEGASYKLKGEARYGNIVYPDNSKVNRFQKSTELNVDGTVGSNPNPSAQVTIDTKYGTIKLVK